MFYEILYKWQTLIGAFLGAATPISLWFLTEWYKKHRSYKEHLYNLEKLLSSNINSLIDAYRTINNFIEIRLPNLIKNIDQRGNLYSIDRVFFPQFLVSWPIANITDVNTKSGYLDNKIIHALRLSQEFPIIIKDVRLQFMNTIELNVNMATNKLNSPVVQNQIYKENINNFINFVSEDMLSKNIKNYMKALVSARIALNIRMDWSIIYWRLKFESHFKYFKNKSDLKKFREDTYNRMDEFFEGKIIDEVNKMQAFYRIP